ncbi:MAG TPA: ABC transporter permease [Thermoleophilaceae bacterium]|nr:ABC transporter permease [Thermoleophilaceae bacterium]
MTARGFRSVVLGVAWRNLHGFFTNPALFLPAMIFPLFFFTAFAGGLSRIESVPGFHFPPGYTAFEYAFVLLQASAFGGVFTGFAVARDFESGFARRMLMAAPRRRALIAGYAVSGLVRALFTISVVTTVAFLAGMKLHGAGIELVGLYTLALLVNFSAVLFGTGVAMRLRTFQAAPAMQVPVFLTLFLAPVYVPLGLLGGWVHTAATVNPITVVLDAERGFIAGDPVKAGLAFALLAGIGALFVFWALRSLRSAERATA